MNATLPDENARISTATLPEEEIVAHAGIPDCEAVHQNLAYELGGWELGERLVERDDRREIKSVLRKQLQFARQRREPEQRLLRLEVHPRVRLEDHGPNRKRAVAP